MRPLLPLPIAPERAITRIINPALSLLPPRMVSAQAVVLILGCMLQESNLAHRWQVVDLRHPERKGPARGLAQFELGGAVKGVCEHPATRGHVAMLSALHDLPFDPRAIWEALDDDDVLAACLARLLLYTDAMPLPPVGAVDAAWSYYLRNWRPGAFTNGTPEERAALRAKWGRNYAKAQAAWDAVEA